MTTALVLLALLALLLAGVDIAFVLAGLGMILLLADGSSGLQIPQALMSSMDNFILLAVPLFILMSNVLLRGGAGARLFAAAQSWVGHWPGGLAVATVLSCAVFAAISGSSVATAATVGAVAIPELTARGYRRRFVFGLLAAGGTLGVLIPPSIPMIVYGFLTEESVVDLFLAGIGPGLLLTALFAGYAVVHARLAGVGRGAARASAAERRRATLAAAPTLALAALVVAGIYAGAFTPTEAAGVGFVLALVVTLGVHRSLRLRDLPPSRWSRCGPRRRCCSSSPAPNCSGTPSPCARSRRRRRGRRSPRSLLRRGSSPPCAACCCSWAACWRRCR